MRTTILLSLIAALMACSNAPKSKPKITDPITRSDTLKIPALVQVDRIIVLKGERQMIVYSKGKKIKTYRIYLGRNPVGPKEYEGDMKTPEGIYSIHDKNPNSSYFKNLGISYPNSNDRKRAAKLGKSPGGDIKIHGTTGKLDALGPSSDWTWGCISVSNYEIEELYNHVIIGASIEIKP